MQGTYTYEVSAPSKLLIRKVIIKNAGMYGEQYHRPYEAHLEVGALNALMNRAADVPASSMTPTMIANTAPGLVSVTQAPVSTNPLYIPGGWAGQRLIFFMDVLATDYTGVSTAYYIQGYTDYAGVSHTGTSLDPDMVFYINNILAVKSMLDGTNSLIDSDHVLCRTDPDSPRQYMARPEDVYKTLVIQSAIGEFGATNNGAETTVHDVSRFVGSVPNLSKRANGIPSRYTADVLQGFIGATMEVDPYEPMSSIYDVATMHTLENAADNNPILSAISRMRSSRLISGSFTWKDLCKMDPHLGSHGDTRVSFVSSGAAMRTTPTAAMSAGWDSAIVETKYAASIAQAVPALMLECMLSRVAFSSTNVVTGEYSSSGVYTAIMDASGMNGERDVARNCEMFKRRLAMELLRDLSYGNQQKFSVTVTSSTFSETVIQISVDGGPVVDYVSPTFCDSITAPVRMDSMDHLSDMAEKMESLVNYVAENRVNASANATVGNVVEVPAVPSSPVKDPNSVFSF